MWPLLILTEGLGWGQDTLSFGLSWSRPDGTEAKVTLKTEDFERSIGKIKGFVGSVGGYLSRSEVREERPRFASLTLAIPWGRLHELLDSIRSLRSAQVVSLCLREIREDPELNRLGEQVSSKRAVLERLWKLMDEAKSVSEAVEVEREIARVSDELAEMEAQLESLRRKARFAYVEVEVQEESGRKLPFLALAPLVSLGVSALMATLVLAILWLRGYVMLSF